MGKVSTDLDELMRDLVGGAQCGAESQQQLVITAPTVSHHLQSEPQSRAVIRVLPRYQ
jgi:hypothetical protein